MYGVGLHEDQLVLALPCRAKDDDQTCICEVQSLDKQLCKVRIMQVPMNQRHLLQGEPDPNWAIGDYAEFTDEQQFHPSDLADAYYSQLTAKTLVPSPTRICVPEVDQGAAGDDVKKEVTGLQDILRNESDIQDIEVGLSGLSEVHFINASMEGPTLPSEEDVLKRVSEVQVVGTQHIRTSTQGPTLPSDDDILKRGSELQVLHTQQIKVSMQAATLASHEGVHQSSI